MNNECCSSCGVDLTDPPRSRCRNTAHASAYDAAQHARYTRLWSTRARQTESFEELRDLVAEYLEARGE